jgi:O-antigen ligase
VAELQVWRESLVGRFTAGTLRFWQQSAFCNWLNGTPGYSSQEAARLSLLGRALAAVFGVLGRPLEVAGAAVRRGLPESLLLKTNLPPVLNNSLALRSLAGIRVETLLWLVFSYILVDYLLRESLGTTSFLASSWDELLLVAAFLAWPVQMALRGKLTYRLTPLDLPILLYLAVAVFLFLVRSPQLGIAVEGVRVYVEYLLWFFVASNLLLNKGQVRALVNWLILLGTLVALHGVYQYIIGVEIPSTWLDSTESVRTRVFSIVGSPNVLGSFLVLVIPITVSQVLSAKSRLLKYFYALCLAPMVLSLLFTYSRGAWLAMAGALAIYGLLYNWRIILALAAGGYAAIEFIPGIASRIGYMLSPAYLLSSARAGRVARWNMALDKLQNHPLFGEGFGRFGGAVAARHIPSSNYVDNFYLKTAAESGILGIAAFLWLLISGIRCALNSYRRLTDTYLKGLAVGLISGLLGVLLHNGVENIFEVPMMTVYFWLLTGMTAALPHLEGQETPPVD